MSSVLPPAFACCYGRQVVPVRLAGCESVETLAPADLPGLSDPDAAILESLRQPIGSPALSDLARGRTNAVILISARDRITGSERLVPIIADELNRAGVPDRAICIYIAAGTHARQTDEDIRSLLGETAYGRFEVRQHDPRDVNALVDLGRTSAGTPIGVNKAVYESSLKILTGRIAHHYFAGFSGGRKAIAPGVSALETITANHRLVLDPRDGSRHPKAAAGTLAGNPVHHDMLEIAAAAQPTFCVNTIVNTRHEIAEVFAGDYIAAHEAGCAVVDAAFSVRPSSQADLVVASCGGWPYDISFMQVIKTIVSAERAVRDGGVLVVIGECSRGIESGFAEWFGYDSIDEIKHAALRNYNLKCHNTLWIREIEARITVVMLSTASPGDVARLRMLPASSIDLAMAEAHRRVGTHPTAAIVPFGNMTSIA